MTVAVVCARAGSKGVPGKNEWALGGTPLIVHAVRTARSASVFDVIVASSDSPSLLRLAHDAGADVSVLRPDHLADDNASKLDAIRHAIVEVEAKIGRPCEIAVDLDVTTPLRTAGDIVDAMRVLDDPTVDRVFTASPARRSPYFNQVQIDGQGVPALPCEAGDIVRRQDSPEVFDLSGAVYVWRRAALFEGGPLLQGAARLHILPPERAWDIDSEMDLVVIEALARRART